MNFIEVNNKSDLQQVINSQIFLPGSEHFLGQETSSNMWAISLNSQSKLTINNFYDFINDLLLNRLEQIKKIKKEATFYLWLDEMAGQLRFNIISGCRNQLPFECKIIVCDDYKEIIKNFFSSKFHQSIPWQEFYHVNDVEIVDDCEFQLNVFNKCLR